MIEIIKLELRRIRRDKRFWFWSLVGVPVLLPALIAMLAFAMASFGTVEPAKVRAQIATTISDEGLLSAFESSGLVVETFTDAAAVREAITTERFSIGLVDTVLEPGRPLSITLLTVADSGRLPLADAALKALEAFAVERRTELVDSLDFDGPSFDLLLSPLEVAEQRVPNRLPPGLLQVITLVWGALLVFPYLLLSWNGSSRIVSDRLSGYLSPLSASAFSPWHWLLARWASLSCVAGVLLAYSALLFCLYMRAYSTFADWAVAQGVLEGLSEPAARSASAYLVHTVQIWRDTSVLSFLVWLTIAFMQFLSLSALILWGSMRAASHASARFFELVPFQVVFLLPLLGLGAVGYGLGLATWVPGLGTVLSVEYMLSGGLPGIALFAAFGISLLTNTLLVAMFIALSRLSLKNERLAFAVA